jgi:hypothetical protein
MTRGTWGNRGTLPTLFTPAPREEIEKVAPSAPPAPDPFAEAIARIEAAFGPVQILEGG